MTQRVLSLDELEVLSLTEETNPPAATLPSPLQQQQQQQQQHHSNNSQVSLTPDKSTGIRRSPLSPPTPGGRWSALVPVTAFADGSSGQCDGFRGRGWQFESRCGGRRPHAAESLAAAQMYAQQTDGLCAPPPSRGEPPPADGTGGEGTSHGSPVAAMRKISSGCWGKKAVRFAEGVKL